MKIITEKTIQIDLRYLKDNGFRYDNDVCGSLYNKALCFTTNTDYILLNYQLNSESIHQRINIRWKDCNYGGNRAYFVCPCCGKAVLTLYLDSKAFKCRTCCNLLYKSQTENKYERMLNKSLKLRKKLHLDSTFSGVIWDKPKGMHHKTFYRLVDKDSELMRQHKDTILKGIRGDV